MTTNITTATIPTTSLFTNEKAQNVITLFNSDAISEAKALKQLEKIAKTTFVDIDEAKAFFTPKSDATPNDAPPVENSDINKDKAAAEQPDAQSDEKDAQSDETTNAKKREVCLGEIKLCENNEDRKKVAIKFSPLYASHCQLKGSAKLKEMIYQIHELGFSPKDIFKLGIYEKSEDLAMGSITDAIRKTQQELGIKPKTTRESTSEGTPRAKVTTLESMKRAIEAKREKIAALLLEIESDEKAYNAQIVVEQQAAKDAAKNTLSVQIAKFKELGMSIEDILAIVNA